VWSAIAPAFERVSAGGTFAIDDWLVPLDRNGYLENCWFTLSYSPIRDESGGVGGLLAVVVETTGRVESERRLATLRELARRAADARTPDQASVSAAEVFAGNSIDVPFAMIYLLDRDGTAARRVSAVGIPPGHPATPERVELTTPSNDAWPLSEVLTTGRTVIRSEVPGRLPALPGGPYDEHTHTVVLLPLSRPGVDHPYGVLVVGVSPRRALDDRYRDFFELAADHIATAISNTVALEEAQRRADALAEIDRVKTAFFSNVSHEFRTPLTLMLGPSEDLLAGKHGPLSETQRAHVDMVRRNARRLLKLVNGLLDFSRIEAGRTQASYTETDLAQLTRELAGSFRSAIESAGLDYQVNCQPIDRPVYVDREMWEKIVLNLLSNAFKFTFEGSIRVELRQRDHHVELTVQDTGVGIPEAELRRVFERFHRVEGTRARTHEGSGIGLALTDELVRLHGGTITATSGVDQGSVFAVQIPIGRAHLPADRIGAVPSLASTAVGTAPFIDEAMRWLPELAAKDERARERILVVDDNADMRDYLRRLLNDWDVETATDGPSALEAARAAPPDLVLTDVMMPGLDGFALLQALRSDASTAGVPVLMVSARAGEEERVSGLAAGADDYLTKPFTARALTARVRSLLALTQARREAELQKQHLHALFMQAPTPIVILHGPNHVIELANPQTCRVWGRNERDVVGRPLLEAVPSVRPFKDLLDGVLRTGMPHVGKETPAQFDRQGDGTLDTVYFNFVYAPLRSVDGTVDGVLIMAFDVTDEIAARNEMNTLRAAAEAANRTKDDVLALLETTVAQRTAELRRSEAYLVEAQRLTRTGCWAVNIRSREILYSSDEHSRLYGFDPGLGLPPFAEFHQRIHPDDRDRVVHNFEAASKTGADVDTQFRMVLPDGTTRYMQAIGHSVTNSSGQVGEFVGILMDITERRRSDEDRETLRRAQADLAHVNRVTTMGELTASLAHEIKQPITAAATDARTCLRWLRRDEPDVAEACDAASRVVKAVTRAADIISSISVLFQKGAVQRERVDVNELIREMILLLRTEANRYSIIIQTDLDPELPDVLADRVQLQQVFMNLMLNGIDAMKAQGGAHVLTIGSHVDNGQLVIAVSDTGVGLPPQAPDQMFRAFFTTKDHGTGMGLPISRSIIESHGGRLRAINNPGRGATFEFTLPAANAVRA
jgi:signal transduction histidine kinase/FixJ family two-component response regulator